MSSNMNLSLAAFRPDWSRIFLDTALDQSLSNLPIADGKCLNVGCGTEGRYGTAADLLCYAVYRSPSGVLAYELAHGRQEVGRLN